VRESWCLVALEEFVRKVYVFDEDLLVKIEYILLCVTGISR
jgi:hypothetical protein